MRGALHQGVSPLSILIVRIGSLPSAEVTAGACRHKGAQGRFRGAHSRDNLRIQATSGDRPLTGLPGGCGTLTCGIGIGGGRRSSRARMTASGMQFVMITV